MEVTKKDVEHVAVLSRLNFDEAEKESMAKALGNMLKHFEKLNSVDVSNVKATAHILDKKNVFREDVAQRITPRDVLLACAPDSDGECYIVPKVLE